MIRPLERLMAEAGGAPASPGGPPASSAPAAPAAASPAASPAAPASGVPVGGEPAAGVSFPAPAAEKPSSLVGDSVAAPEKPAFVKDDALKFLQEKGKTPEELGKMDDAALQSAYDEARAADAPPLEFKLPEGVTIAPEQAKELTNVLNDAKLTPQERGQKLVDMHAAILKDATEAPQKAWRELQTQWTNEIKADPVIGGTNLPETQRMYANLFSAYGKEAGPEAEKAAREAFGVTGAGNNPALARFLRFAAQPYSEGAHVAGSPTRDGSGKSFQSKTEGWYPSAKQSNQ